MKVPVVNVRVELDQRLGLILREPDGADALELDEGERQVRDPVPGQVQHRDLRDVPNLTGDTAMI